VIREGRKHRGCKLLGTVPGIGPLRAAQMVSQMGTPHRFRTKRQLWKYAGLAVVTFTSDDYRVVGGEIRKKKRRATRGLNRNFNRILKDALKGAAQTAANRGDLREYYAGLLRSGMREEMAKLTLARKIAAICLAVWKKGEPYREGTWKNTAVAPSR
jgi:transposase